jgi:DeoR family glycerol-3-phosphate regulon repressor
MTDPALSERQAAILATIEAQGFATLEALADSFGVSMQTVRRDVIAMQAAGLLERFHGGAGVRRRLPDRRIDHGHKRRLAVEEKRAIARRVAGLVPPGATVYLDVGTTMEAAAEALNGSARLAIVTNSLRVAAAVDPDRHAVQVLPGRVRGPDGSLTGEETVLALARLRVDIALISCSAIEPGGAVMDFDAGKIAIKRCAMDIAREAILLAVSDKFGRTARAEIAPLTRFHRVLTENGEAAPAEA